MSRQMTICFALVLCLLTPISVKAEVGFVYLINIDGEKCQTGFRVRGVKGIITALHGVLRAKEITAYTPVLETALKDKSVRLSKVDIESDLAILTNDELEKSEALGFDCPVGLDLESLAKREVSIVGYPIQMSMKGISSKLLVRDKAIDKLRYLLAPSSVVALEKHGSPGVDTKVLYLQGEILPGHSGSPIIDEQKRVVAVANGGRLYDGNGVKGISHFVWAIPLASAKFTSADANLKLEKLKRNPLPDFFTNNTDPKKDQEVIEKLAKLGSQLNLIEPDIAKFATIEADPKCATFVFPVEPSNARVVVLSKKDEQFEPYSLIVKPASAKIEVRGRFRMVKIQPTEGGKAYIGVWTNETSDRFGLRGMAAPNFLEVKTTPGSIEWLEQIKTLKVDRIGKRSGRPESDRFGKNQQVEVSDNKRPVNETSLALWMELFYPGEKSRSKSIADRLKENESNKPPGSSPTKRN